MSEDPLTELLACHHLQKMALLNLREENTALKQEVVELNKTISAQGPHLLLIERSLDQYASQATYWENMCRCAEKERDENTLARKRVTELEADCDALEVHQKELEARLAEAEGLLKRMFATHYECEDCWYSCPKSPGCCGEESGDRCTCGKDEVDAYFEKWGKGGE
jgi:chromosome segregation ATPase